MAESDATKMPIILGIDPGTNLMGYALVTGVKSRPEMIALGVIELGKIANPYMRLRRIFERVSMLAEQYCPDALAIEAPFFGKNVQSMLKLGRAQGVAIAAALVRDIPVAEYEPRSIKQAIVGNGGASKEQVRAMLVRTMNLDEQQLPRQLDATDALAAALCHFYEMTNPFGSVGAGNTAVGVRRRSGSSWADFIARNPERVK
ncbi:MAG: crossover junction endodeoxyribonuclease RuvC [Roseburia sp.]|nr:crossover junction endodeoxyribonuclease RuvC [Roseburia sp.]